MSEHARARFSAGPATLEGLRLSGSGISGMSQTEFFAMPLVIAHEEWALRKATQSCRITGQGEI